MNPLPQSEWVKVKSWAEERLTDLQKLNENPALGIEATALHRGAILTLRKLIAWGEPEVAPTTTPERLEY